MPQISRMRIARYRPAWSRQLVFKKFNARCTCHRSHAGYTGSRAREAVEILLLDSHVQRAPRDGHAEQIAIELGTVLGAPHRHGRMVDAEKEIVGRLMPDWIAFPFREPEQFQVVPVRITKLDRLDAGGSGIRDGNRLRTRWDPPHA